MLKAENVAWRPKAESGGKARAPFSPAVYSCLLETLSETAAREKNNRTREKRVFELSKQKKETQTCTKSNWILLTTVSTNLIDQAKAQSEHVFTTLSGLITLSKNTIGVNVDDTDMKSVHYISKGDCYYSFTQKMGDDSDINRIHSHRDPFTNNLSDLINALDRFFGERPTHSNSTTVRKVRRRPRIPVNAESATSSMARSAHLEQLHTSGMSSGEDAKNNTADNSDSENEISSRYVLPFDRQVGRRRANSHVEPDSIMDTSQKRKTYRRRKPIKRMVVDSCLPAGKTETNMEVDNSPASRFIPFGACLRVPKRICSESSMEHDDSHTVPSSDSEDNVSSCDHGRDGDDELSDFPTASFCSDSCDSDDLDTSRSILRKIRNNLRNNLCDGEYHAVIFDSTDSDVSPSANTKKTKLDQ
ncbi:hypothetical protein T07_11744 [Trichinella nelsoni]|uniref:Uncharacterized protein n=1 Tax=Trichinella nelsoni TaxID=6336 RepID=A0A0V0RMA0_9BILA|nr:hypothetical protein T07_11744 [Trichinella nelsoni]